MAFSTLTFALAAPSAPSGGPEWGFPLTRNHVGSFWGTPAYDFGNPWKPQYSWWILQQHSTISLEQQHVAFSCFWWRIFCIYCFHSCLRIEERILNLTWRLGDGNLNLIIIIIIIMLPKSSNIGKCQEKPAKPQNANNGILFPFPRPLQKNHAQSFGNSPSFGQGIARALIEDGETTRHHFS